MAAIATKAKSIVTQCFSNHRTGVVVSAGRTDRAVRVRVAGQTWNKAFRKQYPEFTTYMASDPNNSVVEGDIVRITSGYRTSKRIHHVVTSIVAPFGEPVENRSPVFSQKEINEIRVKNRLLKDVRSAERGRLESKLRIKEARKQGLRIPTLDEALEARRKHEKAEAAILATKTKRGPITQKVQSNQEDQAQPKEEMDVESTSQPSIAGKTPRRRRRRVEAASS